MDSFINLNKSANMTSHDAVNIVRKIFQTKKVGHAGTLDPFATGILPIAINRATKFIEYIADHEKTYRAEILFGMSTDSGDPDGKIILNTDNFTMPTVIEIQSVTKNFIGEISQTPSKFSAIKINGRKAYDLARKNISFDMPSRIIKINRIEILRVDKNILTAEIDCGKGTYIRSLAEDIGKAFNIPTTLKSLCRLRVGNFNIDNAATIEDLKNSPEKFCVPVENCLNFRKFFLPAHRLKAYCNGLPTTVRADNELVKVYCNEKFLGVGKIFDGELRSAKLIDTEI